jgi:hypothetical protein
MRRIARALGTPDAAFGPFDLQRRPNVPLALADIGVPEDGIDLAAKLATRNAYVNPRSLDAPHCVVLGSFVNTPDPRRKTLIAELVLSFARTCSQDEPDKGFRDRFPDAHRTEMHRHAPGVHSAVGRARRLHNGRRDLNGACS